MRIIGKVKYNGKSTADLGVIVSGEASFDAAAPDYTSYQIPGKNGDLMLSNNRYLNIDVTYPAFIPADFEEKVQAIRNWMRSARSYARIEDNYDLLHYRMGMGKDVLTFEPSAENVGSNMSLVFDCKPQRYLYSGEEENQIGVWGPVQAASGDVVTFEDDENGAFKSISASITPTQDLHGYDYPWPAGGGNNLVDAATYRRIAEAGLTVTLTDSTLNGYDATQIEISGTAVSWGWRLFQRNSIRNVLQPNTSYRLTMVSDANQPFFAAIATTASSQKLTRDLSFSVSQFGGLYQYVSEFTTFASDNPAWESTDQVLLIGVMPDTLSGITFTLVNNICLTLQSATTGWEPYSNICPITGRTEATVWRTGKNLLADTNFRDSFVANDITFTRVSGGHYKVSGTCTSTTWLHIMSSGVNGYNIPVSLPTGTYTLSSGNLKVYCYLYRGDWDGDYVYGRRSVTSENMPVTGVRYLILAGATFDDDDIYLQLNKGTADTPYTPYSGTSYPVSWQSEAGTVYGGTVDVVSGVLTCTMKYIIVDGDSNIGKENTGWANNYEAFYINISANKGIQPPSTLDTPNALSNQLRIVNYRDLRRGDRPFDFSLTSGGSYIEWTSTSMTLEEEKARLAETPIYICYELATPQTYQLSGQQIKTLLGLNNVWADSGTVTAEWGEDPFGLYNPTLFDALPMIKVKNPQNGCTVTVNGTTVTCSRSHTGTVTIDCELMDVSSGATNLNADWSKDFPKLSPGENSVAFSGADAVTIIPRWWEL